MPYAYGDIPHIPAGHSSSPIKEAEIIPTAARVRMSRSRPGFRMRTKRDDAIAKRQRKDSGFINMRPDQTYRRWKNPNRPVKYAGLDPDAGIHDIRSRRESRDNRRQPSKY